MQIRYLGSRDLTKIEDFYEQYEDNMIHTVDLDLDHMLECAEEELGFYIGAFNRGKLIGVISLGGAEFYANANDAIISDLYVLPEYRNQGVGGKLVEYALAQADIEFGGDVYADILDDNLADYYSRFGFETFIEDDSGICSLIKRNIKEL